jgi:hypothetical protein
MKTLVQRVATASAAAAFAIAGLMSAPVAAFAQVSTAAPAQGTAAEQSQAGQQMSAHDSSGYGSASRGTWQAGHSSETTVSSYSPPVYNAR